MNKELGNQEFQESIPEPDSFDPLRPWIGTIIGVLVFVLLLSLLQITESRILATSLLWPGMLVAMLGIASNMVTLFVLSSIPFGIIGFMMASKEKRLKQNRILLLAIYFITSILVGIFVLSIGAIYNNQ
jgi:hypothetical protein